MESKNTTNGCPGYARVVPGISEIMASKARPLAEHFIDHCCITASPCALKRDDYPIHIRCRIFREYNTRSTVRRPRVLTYKQSHRHPIPHTNHQRKPRKPCRFCPPVLLISLLQSVLPCAVCLVPHASQLLPNPHPWIHM